MYEGLTETEYKRLKRIVLQRNIEGRLGDLGKPSILRNVEYNRLREKASIKQLKTLGFTFTIDGKQIFGRERNTTIE